MKVAVAPDSKVVAPLSGVAVSLLTSHTEL